MSIASQIQPRPTSFLGDFSTLFLPSYSRHARLHGEKPIFISPVSLRRTWRKSYERPGHGEEEDGCIDERPLLLQPSTVETGVGAGLGIVLDDSRTLDYTRYLSQDGDSE
jgi:hypothetical protein